MMTLSLSCFSLSFSYQWKSRLFEQEQIALRCRQRHIRRQQIAVAQLVQLRAEIDEAFRHHMDDEAGALQAAAHGEKARGHDGAAVAARTPSARR